MNGSDSEIQSFGIDRFSVYKFRPGAACTRTFKVAGPELIYNPA